MNPNNRRAIKEYGITAKELRALNRRELVGKFIKAGHSRPVAIAKAKQATRGY